MLPLTARIFRGEVGAGAFDALDLRIKSVDAQLKKNHRPAAVKNTLGPAKTSFQAPANGETLLVIDLVATDMSDHPPRGYELASTATSSTPTASSSKRSRRGKAIQAELWFERRESSQL